MDGSVVTASPAFSADAGNVFTYAWEQTVKLNGFRPVKSAFVKLNRRGRTLSNLNR